MLGCGADGPGPALYGGISRVRRCSVSGGAGGGERMARFPGRGGQIGGVVSGEGAAGVCSERVV